MDKMIDGGGMRGRRVGGGALRARRRGFIHILLLVFTVLGVSLWGITEMLHRSQEASRESELKHSERMSRALEALLDYAVLAPERIQAEERAGRYNVYAGRDNVLRHRYFTMPCPDSHLDGNWDGASDWESSGGCDDVTATDVRIGRFPWRTESAADGGQLSYIRGMGEDLVDRHGDRFWYAAAYNMLRRDRAVNPHWLLRQTHGWIALAENDTLVEEAETSYIKRVAGVVVSPGIAGSDSNVNDRPELLQRIPEVGAVSVTVAASVALANIAAYLEINLPAAADDADCNFGFGWNYSDVCSTQDDNIPPFQRRTPTGERINNLIYYNSPPESRSDDRLAYITVEELAADGGKGVELMLGQPGNVLDIIAGGRGFLGVRQVMNSYFNRHGALPAPAAFNQAAGENLVRLRGAPGGGGEAGAWIESAAGVTVTAVLPVKSIRRVYLQPGAVLLAEDANFNRDGFPPYNLALYGMETSFNTEPMPGDVRTALMAEDIYPRENLLGYRNTVTAFATESTRVRSISPPPDGGALPPLDARVYLKKAPPVRGVSFSPEQRIAGLEIPMALAEPALAHIVGGALSSVVAGHIGGVVSESPNYGLQVELPEGTRFMLSGDELNPVSLFLRGGVQSPPAEYNIAERRWELTRQWPEPVLLEYPSDGVVTITAVIENSNVRSANIGFLPVDDTAVDYYSPGSSYRFEGDRMRRGRVTLRAGNRFGGLRADSVHGANSFSVLRPRFPVSVLPEDLVLYTESRLVVSPFPPPGRPVLATTAVSSPHPLYINYEGGLAGQVSPGAAFTLPEGTRIFYPAGSAFDLGVDFEFPAGTRALLPDGAVMTLQALSGSTLPDGRRADLQNIRVSMGVTLGDAVAGLQARAVTLVHGGVMDLYGPSGTTGADSVQVQGAAVVLRDGTGVGSSQELFNIEHGIGGVVGTPQSTVNFYGAVLQPLAAREIRGGVESLSFPFDQPFRLSTWTRMQFLTRPQNVVDFAGAYRITVTLEAHAVPGVTNADSIEQQATVAGPLLVRNYQWQGSRAVTVELMALSGATVGVDIVTAVLTLSEQTRFMLPPGEYNRFDMSVGGGVLFGGAPGQIIRLDGGFIFPVRTAFYDPNLRSLEGFSVGGVNGWPALAAPLTVSLTDGLARGAIQSQLVMFLDSGLHAVSVTRNDSETEEVAPIPANSVWSMLSNNAFPPGSFAEWMRADGEVGAVSGGEIMMYFPEGVILTNRGVYEVVGRYQNSPATLEVNYSPPCNCTVTLAYAGAGAGEFAGVGVVGTATLSLVGVTADFNEGPITTDIGGLALPGGSFIVLPAGSTLDFLTESKSFGGSDEDDVDFTVLPEVFTAVLPGGSTVNLGSGGELAVSGNGLGYLRFDGGPAGPATITTDFGEREQGVFRMALVAHPDFMPDTPLIYYTEDTYLTGLHGLRDNVGVRIPAGSRGDLFGMIYGRHSPDFEVNALPSDTAGALRNFPMVYAVAPNCREDIGGGGEDCADGDRGLEFAVETGERVELEHELIPHGNIYITLHSEAAEGLPFAVTHRNNEDFYTGEASTISITVVALGVNGDNGEVHRFQPPVAGRPGELPRDFMDEIHEAVVPAGAPSGAVFRVYMDVPDSDYGRLVANGIAPPQSVLDGLHYAEMRAITLFAGGWSRDSDVADAKVKVALDAPRGSGRLQLGYGANIGGNLEDEFIFGRGGYYDVRSGGNYRLPLDGYKLAGPLFGFELGFNSESTHADVDFAGNVLSEIGAQERVVVKEEQSLALNEDGGAGFAAAEIITLHEDAQIDMEPGYLWQGYLDVKSRGESAPRLSLSFDRHASLGGDFRNQVFVRVHPQDDRLNFWGSGRETPMGLDGRSPDHRSHTVKDASGNFVRWGKIQPVDALDFEFHVHDNRITLAQYISDVNGARLSRDDHVTAEFLRKVGPVSPYFLDDRYPLGGGFPPGSGTRERDFSEPFFNRIAEHNLDFWHRTPGGSINRIPVSYVITAGRVSNIPTNRINRINIRGIQDSPNADGAAYDGISPNISEVSNGFNGIEAIGRGAHGNGYRSQILDGSRRGGSSGTGMRMLVRVRNADGEIIADDSGNPVQELRWNPVYRPLLPSAGRASSGFYTITVAGTSDVRTRRGWVAWGANNSPFDIPDQSYVNEDEVWAVRIHAAYNHDGSLVTVSDGDRMNLTGTIAGGGRVDGIFDMPPFQLRSAKLGRPSASHYADSANIISQTIRVRPCGGAPSSENINSARVPALLLGHWADAERHDSGSGTGCGTDIGQRLPSFSTRPRRGAGLDPWESVPISVVVSVNQIRADLFGGGGTMVLGGAGGTVLNIYPVIDIPQNEQVVTLRQPNGTIAVLPNQDYRNFGGTPGDDVLRTFGQRAATWSRSTLSISYSEFIDSGRGAPFRRTRRSPNLAETGALIFDDGFEVRGAQNGDPEDFNRDVPVDMSLSYNSENPLNYVVPLFNDGPADLYARDRDGQRFSERDSTLFRSSGATMAVEITAPVEAPVFGDMAFYMDRAYRTRGFGGAGAQTLHIGDDFRIAGPGALVPHFGGHNMGAVADVYAARSAFLHGLFGGNDNFKLHRVYSANTGGEHCPSSLRSSPPEVICPAMYDPDNARYWIPIISGIAAFEAVSIGFAGDSGADFDVFTVLPQPEAAVLAEDGSTLTIYGGSVIRPRERTVRRALRIPANSTLVLFGDAAAAVDVSPVYAPTPINLIREDAIMRERDFNFNPIRSANFIIEPLGFIPPEEDHIINFGDARLGTGEARPTACMANSYENREQGGRVYHNWEYGEWCRALQYNPGVTGAPNERNVVYGYNTSAATTGPANRVGSQRSLDSSFRITTAWPTRGLPLRLNYTPGLEHLSNADQENPRFFALTIQGPSALNGDRPDARPPDNIRTHHDGTMARGFLMNDDMADLMTDYFRGDPLFVRSNKFITYFPRRGYNALGEDSGTIRARYFFDSLPPANNQVAPPGNPLSWHWLQGHDGDSGTYNGTFIPMGAARQFHFPQDRANPDVPIYVLTEECHGRYPQYPTPPPPPDGSGSYYMGAPLDAGTFDAVPCAGEDSHYWVGVYYNPEFEEPDGGASLRDEFTALRLPHSIRIPATAEIALTPYRNTPLYPITTSQFFEFPADSTARILQVDAASWESVHPYAARYMPGAVFANDGGLNPDRRLRTTDNLRAITEETRRLLRAAEEMRVSENNDGIREIDVGGLKVLHFAKTESSHRYRSSNVDVHTNVWIKLLHGGYLKNERGEAVVNLPPNTVINPVLGTYLPGEPSAPVERTLKSNYQAVADVEPARSVEIARPAMVIPPGTTIRIGAAGANITEVKAAAIFSVAPLDNINCAAGGVSGGEFLQNGLPDSVAVSQSREGVSENAYSGEFTVGHPCAWLDDRENTDGDRFFVYRSRRRYLEPYKSRVLSNDRTYLFGGTLRLS